MLKKLGHVPVISYPCVSIIVQELHPSYNRIAKIEFVSVFQRKLWSKLSKALLKSEKKINPGSSVCLHFQLLLKLTVRFLLYIFP